MTGMKLNLMVALTVDILVRQIVWIVNKVNVPHIKAFVVILN